MAKPKRPGKSRLDTGFSNLTIFYVNIYGGTDPNLVKDKIRDVIPGIVAIRPTANTLDIIVKDEGVEALETELERRKNSPDRRTVQDYNPVSYKGSNATDMQTILREKPAYATLSL